ncbi:MAG: acyloxyacyl hydrolase, partial [Flavobacteriales bacterium]
MTSVRAGILMAAFVVQQCHAQQPDFSLGARGGYGYLIAHHDNLKRMVDGHIPSMEVFYERVVSGKQQWHHRYKSPSWGVAFMAADLRAEELGNAFRLTPYLLLPLTFDQKQSLDLRFGWGLGAVTRPFDRQSNYKGHAIGSTLNVHMLLALEYQRHFGRTSIGIGLGIDHLSNGAYRVPNLGINLPAVQLSVRQGIGTRALTDTLMTAGERDRTTHVIAYATAGIKETFPVNSGKHMAYAVVVAALKPMGRKIALEGGIDVFHNMALEQRALEDGQDP